MTGTFSVSPSDHKEIAYDWRWQNENKGWQRSERDGARWYSDGPIQAVDVLPLLRIFGLEDFLRDFPLSRLERTGPNALIMTRRALEKTDLKLQCLEVVSITVGYHAKAEEHADGELPA